MVTHLQLENPEMEGDDLYALAQSFIDSFIEYRTDFPDSPLEWYITEKAEVTYQSANTLSIQFSHSNYLGGAHGMSFINYLNVDPRTGEVLGSDELILDRNALLTLAEKKFREFHKIENEVTLEEDGRFFLDEGRFFLPGAMGFAGEMFRMVYNPYEIAPYALGYTELEFTPEELSGIVKW